MSELVTCKDLTKRFGNHTALDHLNLSLDSGKIIGLLGPNGSGKTTLLKLLNGLLTPSEGEVLIAVGLGHAAVLKLEAVLNQLIRGMEGQRGGDVLVVRGGNGDAAALLRCSRDVLRAEVGEFAATHAHGA